MPLLCLWIQTLFSSPSIRWLKERTQECSMTRRTPSQTPRRNAKTILVSIPQPTPRMIMHPPNPRRSRTLRANSSGGRYPHSTEPTCGSSAAHGLRSEEDDPVLLCRKKLTFEACSKSCVGSKSCFPTGHSGIDTAAILDSRPSKVE